MALNPAIAALFPARKPQSTALEQRFNFQEWVDLLNFNGVNYPANFTQTLVGDHEPIGGNFAGLVEGAYKRNSLVAACLLTRLTHFCEARFLWRRMRNGRPGPLFSDAALTPIQKPWPNGTTGDLLARMIVDADLGGMSLTLAQGDRVQRLRPDWTDIVLGSYTGRADFQPGDPDETLAGYMYHPGGKGKGRTPLLFLPEHIASFAPIPDPLCSYRGMSILTAALTEIQADQSMSRHRQRFFDNGATVNLVVKMTAPTLSEFNEYVQKFRDAHDGERNAYKALFVNQATDVERIGADMQQLEFHVTQGAGETRVAAALRTHPVIVGLSEGMAGSSLNAGNYQSARRAFADGTMRPLWRQAAGALETILRVPGGGAELWVDDRDIAFLREDIKDIAEVQQMRAGAALSLINAGWEPDAITDYLANNDISVLLGNHTGLFTVQLQPPGSSQPAADSSGSTVAQTGNG